MKEKVIKFLKEETNYSIHDADSFSMFMFALKNLSDEIGIIDFYVNEFVEVVKEIFEADKTAHDKLLEIGFQLIDDIHPELKCYYIDDDNKYMEVYINTSDKVFYVPDNETIDLELSKLLTQYLEELGNE